MNLIQEDYIPEVTEKSSDFEKTVILQKKEKKKLAKGFLNNAGIFVSVLLMFVVVVVMTTDIHIGSFEELASLGLDFFILLFVSYSMYVSCSDSGMRQGLQSSLYTDTLKEFDAMKKQLIETKMQARLGEFCANYIQEELKNEQTSILTSVGLSYEIYLSDYIGKDKEDILGSCLSETQKRAVLRANAVTPIKLTPDMILKRGRGHSRRAPLGRRPETQKYIVFSTKFISTLGISLAMSLVVLDAVLEPSWALFVACCLKLVTVVANGFGGYKFGYENIIFDTVHYMHDQIDLMQQAVQYFAEKK